MEEIKGNLITLAQEGEFDLIGHGCNCFCTMGKGIAPQIKEAFPEAWEADQVTSKGDFRKLGNYSFGFKTLDNGNSLTICNIYSQYNYNRRGQNKVHLDYTALTLALRKINFEFHGLSIGLPLIGAGLGGGNWELVKQIIETELKDMDVTIVHYEK